MSGKASKANVGDVVMVECRYIGVLGRAYPRLTATDRYSVTRVDRSRGRAALFLRKVGAKDQVVVAWPEQVRVIERLVPERPRRQLLGGKEKP